VTGYGGPEFKGKFKQSYIESFNRILRKECLGWGNYHPKDIPQMNKDLTEYYHSKRVHCSLNMQTPSDILKQFNLMADI